MKTDIVLNKLLTKEEVESTISFMQKSIESFDKTFNDPTVINAYKKAKQVVDLFKVLNIESIPEDQLQVLSFGGSDNDVDAKSGLIEMYNAAKKLVNEYEKETETYSKLRVVADRLATIVEYM